MQALVFRQKFTDSARGRRKCENGKCRSRDCGIKCDKNAGEESVRLENAGPNARVEITTGQCGTNAGVENARLESTGPHKVRAK